MSKSYCSLSPEPTLRKIQIEGQTSTRPSSNWLDEWTNSQINHNFLPWLYPLILLKQLLLKIYSLNNIIQLL